MSPNNCPFLGLINNLNYHRHATRNKGGLQAWLGLVRNDLYTNAGNGEVKQGGSRAWVMYLV